MTATTFPPSPPDFSPRAADHVTLFLAGDVMTGRGIDQILMCPGAPEIDEWSLRDAREYVALAERASGPIPRAVGAAYIWGDALAELERIAPAARIINLETSITRSPSPEPKGINYRMHPGNLACLTVARIDVCALANNHVLDYGPAGLEETLATLAEAGVQTAGAGRNRTEAQRAAIVETAGGARVIVFAFGTETSGIPTAWTAGQEQPGVDVVVELSDTTADDVVARVRAVKRPADVVIASIHWGSNWGYAVPPAHVGFAHRLIDGGVDIVHGHSSHHPRPIEVYRDKLILYGCGDFIDDYEGISGYEPYRDDLALMYFPTIDRRTGHLVALRMTALRIRRMRLQHASRREVEWLRDTLSSVSAASGSRIDLAPDGSLRLHWKTDDQRGMS